MEVTLDPDPFDGVFVTNDATHHRMSFIHPPGLKAEPENLRVEDPNLNLPELRADHLFIMQPEAADACAIYLECQLEPDARLLPSWSVKWAGLCRQLDMPVALLVLYLQRGDSATFPDHYHIQVGAIQTTLYFTAIRLWEHADRIRSGELPELAPLLLLCEETPTVPMEVRSMLT